MSKFNISTTKCGVPHRVEKPWGHELWLELNDKYCYKRIYIKAGTQTSYQYHHKKLETNFIIEGTAEIWLENDEGSVDKKIMKAGEYFTVLPPRKHRVIAISDIILQEVSTPEVDDVIRITDDFKRGDGKIDSEHMNPALCILTAGVGGRLKKLSHHINKGLLPLNSKAVISHLIMGAPFHYDIVVLLGYKGDMVREYCEAAHPDRNFTFVQVDKYEGDDTGPGRSIACAREFLQRPFVWTTSDTVIKDQIPMADCDWLGLCPTSVPQMYSTANVKDGSVISFKNKSPKGYDHAFIGIAGVHDYKTFWGELDAQKGGADESGSHKSCSEIIRAYYDLSKYTNVKAKIFEWYDVGTIDNYLRAKSSFEVDVEYSIPKTTGEFLYKIDDRFLKLSSDKKFIKGRVERAKNLQGLIPDLTYSGSNLYSYSWIKGETLYSINNSEIWKKFLNFASDRLWAETKYDEGFSGLCKEFYFNKTRRRLKMFLSARDDSFRGKHHINGVDAHSIDELLEDFNWEKIYEGIPTKLFHGDLQFDNVIYGEDGQFHLLDWRHDFAGCDIGDVYYDLSKMYGGILMSYNLMKNEKNFSCSVEGDVVTYEHKPEGELSKFTSIYENWILDGGYDLEKVKLITSLIFLNMSPLHGTEFGNMLFFHSKRMLGDINDK